MRSIFCMVIFFMVLLLLAIALTTLYCCGGISKLLAVIVNHFTFHEVPENPNLNDALLWFHAALLIVPAACLM